MSAKFAPLLINALLIRCAFTSNILYISSMPSPSHYLWNKQFSLALIEKGHNVTLLTPDSEDGPTPTNFTAITMEGIYKAFDSISNNYEGLMQENTLSIMKTFYGYIEHNCELDLKSQGLKTILSYPKNKFDLIIVDATAGRCLYPLIDEFNKPPVVAVTAFSMSTYLFSTFGMHIYSFYMPYEHSRFLKNMNLMERMFNFLYISMDAIYRDYFITPNENALARKRFGSNTRALEEIEKSISILLTNGDPVLDYPIALPPNIIQIGGLHVKPPKSLPTDLEIITSEATHGIILFSLGTNIHFELLKTEQRQALISVLEQFPQIILWKIRSQKIGKLPKNVIVRKWLPQNDILGHPNTKLFITHGGTFSIQEAMYHGVPMVSIPFIIDQYINARRIKERKLGKYLDRNNLTVDNVYRTVKEVLYNPIYKSNIMRVSKLYRQKPQTSLEKAVFWTEYVLRNGNGEHLVVPARDMPFYVIYNLDVVGLLTAMITIVYKLIFYIIRLRKSLVICRKSNKETLLKKVE